jgi:hypothetical protein
MPASPAQPSPAQPAVFVVVPHVDKRPARTCVLKVRIVQVSTIDGGIVVDCGWDVDVSYLFSVLAANDVAQTTVVHSLRTILRILDDLVDEIAEVKYEAELLLRKARARLRRSFGDTHFARPGSHSGS